MFRETTFNDAARLDTALNQSSVERADFAMDETTFRAFYDRTARGVWAYLARVSGDRQLADDLLQETYYRFLRASTEHQSDEHRRNSLYRIATNLARDTSGRQLIRAATSFVGHDIERAPSPGLSDSNDTSTDVGRAMNKLKPRERAMLWLAYAEGASHREIAERVGVEAGSMKLLLFRARRKLASLLDGGSK